jgi:hypothetical protein
MFDSTEDLRPASPRNQAEDQDHEGDDQQQVNERTRDVCNQSEQPQDDQHHDDCVEHEVT